MPGPGIAHIGFAMVILGAVLSNAKKDIISNNQFGDLEVLNEALSNDEGPAALGRRHPGHGHVLCEL